MSEPPDNERVTHEIDILTAAFEKQATSQETTEQTAAAFLEYILQREHIRRDVTAPGPSQEAVDTETLNKLKNCRLDDPEYVIAEAVFRRLGVNPTDGIDYLERLVSIRQVEISEKMSEIAKKPRPEARRMFAPIIDGIVGKNPNISERELLHKLRKHEDIDVVGDSIHCVHSRDAMRVDALRGALSRSKKRVKKSR